MAEVRVQEGEPLENALRRFKRKVQTEDIIKEVKRHSFYLKPGEKKRVKEALARKRPLDQYTLQITVDKLTLNQPLDDEQFVLKIPDNIPIQKM